MTSSGPGTRPRHRNSTGPRVIAADDRAPGSEPELDLDRWAVLTDDALGEAGVDGDAELSLTFVDVDMITSLNREHLGGSGPTDVLSFPLEDAAFSEPFADGVPRLLGDIVICPAVAAENAPGHAGTLDDELALLCVHGILHVLGWDHATPDDARAMRAEEARILASVHGEVAVGTEIPE